MKYPKLLFVIDNLSTGGAQRQLIHLAIGLKQRGYTVEVFCYAPGDMLAKSLIDAGIKIHWCFKRSRYSPDIILALRHLINRGQFDLSLSFLTTPNFYAIVTGQVLTSGRIPVIVSERFCDLPQGVNLTEQISRQFYRLATHLVTNSHHQRINLAKKYPWLENRLSTIYNGYDLESFIPAKNQIHHRPPQILAIASVSPYKNGLCLVKALNILYQRHKLLLHVDWIGQLVMKGDRLEYLNEMKHAISKYGLEEQWTWLNQRTDIVQQLHQHDVLVHPSFGEGLPNVVCEALACGKPVIVSNCLDHPYLVQDDQSGYLFDWQDPAELAEKIRLFCELSDEQRAEMGRKGRQFAEANLSMDRYVDDYEHLFLKILNH